MIKSTLILSIVLSLTACSYGKDELREISKAENTISLIKARTDENKNKNAGKYIKSNPGIWLGADPVFARHGDPLPNTGDFAIWLAKPASLVEVANTLTSLLAIPVRVEGRLGEVDKTPIFVDQNLDAAGNPIDGFRGPQKLLPPLNKTEQTKRSIQYEGTVEGFLNSLAAQFNIEWKYEAGVLRLYSYTTETFTLLSFSGNTSFETSVESMGGNQASQGASGQSDVSANGLQRTLYQAKLDIWTEIEKTILGLLPPESMVVPARTTGTITVSAPTWAMGAVRDYMTAYNERLSRQVSFQINIYSVTHNKNRAAKIGGALQFTDLQERFGFKFLGENPHIGTSNSILSGSIIAPDPASNFNKLKGTTLAAEVLKTTGSVALVDSLMVNAMNHEPAPVAFTNRRSFLKSSTASALGVGGSQVSLQPGVVSTGFIMTLVANIQANGTMLLHITANLSELVSLDTIAAGGSLIQAPNVNSRDVMLKAYVATGSTIILTGFESERNTASQSGEKWASPLFGRSQSGRRETSKLYITVTPVLLKTPRVTGRG